MASVSSSKGKNIQVYVRCRPLNNSEKKSGAVSVIDVNQHAREIVVKERLGDKELSKKFTFDKVFGFYSTQSEVYKTVVSPLIEEVLMGYNCTVFAYGQTGTGKTHTMIGAKSSPNLTWEDDPGAGIIPRTLHDLYDALSQLEVEFNVRVSFLELYNEELYDLLAPCPDGTKLRMLKDNGKMGSGTIWVQGLEEKIVHNKEEIFNVLEKGTERRRVGSTLMNDQSSRSHTVFTITIHIKEANIDGEDLLKIGKLNLVDLAGSECIGRSGAMDKRAREAGNINQSLLTLGRVITALVEKAPHVPYRESKLTRLLQDSLGGRTKTSIIATISPATINLEETLSTLDYAYRAKNIMNKPEVNQKLTKKAVLREYAEEIERLRKDLVASRDKNGVYLDVENYEFMQSKIAGLSTEVKDKLASIDKLKEQLFQIEELFATTKVELAQKERQLNHTTRVLDKTQSELKETVLTLKVVTTEKEEQEYLVNHRAMIEKQLTEQAQKLIEVANETTNHVEGLHSKIERKKLVESTNEIKCQDMKTEIGEHVKYMKNFAASVHKTHKDSLTTFQAQMNEIIASQLHVTSQQPKVIHELINLILNERATTSQNMDCCKDYVSDWSEQNGNIDRDNKDKIIKEQESRNHETSELIAKLLKIMMEQNELIVTQSEMFQKNVESACKSLQTNFDKVEEEIGQFEALEQNYLRKIQTEIEVLENKGKIVEEQRKSLLVSWQQQENLLLQTIQKTRTLIEGHDKTLEENLPQIHKSTENIKKETVEKYSASLNHFETIKVNTKNTFSDGIADVEKMKQCFESVTSNVRTDKDAINETCNEIKTTVHENLQGLKFNFDVYQKTKTEEYSKLENEIDSNRSVVLSGINGLAEETSVKTTKLISLVENVQEKSNDICTLQVQMKDSFNEWSGNTHNSLQDLISKVEEKVESFVDGLAKDIPTGATPQRKEFTYPKDLIATSPHQQILQRFRQTVATETSDAEFVLPEVPQLDLDPAEVLPLHKTSSLLNIASTPFGNDSACSLESSKSADSTPANNYKNENKPVKRNKATTGKLLKPPTSINRTGGRVLSTRNMPDRSISPK